MVENIRQKGLEALTTGITRISQAAERISSPEQGPTVEDAVQLSIGKREVAVGVKLSKVAEELDREILKIGS